jgi:hypothetical protein
MPNINKSDVLITEKNSTWCTLSIDKIRVRAKIKHIGGGKFEILDDESGGKYRGNIVDASEVYHCK